MSAQNDRSETAANSVVVNTISHLVALVSAWYAASLVGRWVRAVRAAFETAAQSSSLARSGRTVATWVRASRGYRWLTTEPDQTRVVVVDLRETWTVGPFVVALDRILTLAHRLYLHSALCRAGNSLSRSFRRAPIRVASVVVCVAVLANTAGSLADGRGAVGGSELAIRAVILLVGVTGTQIRTPLHHLADAHSVRLLVAAFEPPNPEADAKSDSGDL